MCTSGKIAEVAKSMGAKVGNNPVLSSGGYDGGVPTTGSLKDILRRRRKQGQVPQVPLLGQSGEEVTPT